MCVLGYEKENKEGVTVSHLTRAYMQNIEDGITIKAGFSKKFDKGNYLILYGTFLPSNENKGKNLKVIPLNSNKVYKITSEVAELHCYTFKEYEQALILNIGKTGDIYRSGMVFTPETIIIEEYYEGTKFLEEIIYDAVEKLAKEVPGLSAVKLEELTA